MTLSSIPFKVKQVQRVTSTVTLDTDVDATLISDLQAGMTVYLTTVQGPCPRTSDMQDLVDRCEAKVKAPENAWRKCQAEDMTYVVDQNQKTIAMIPSAWWLKAETDEERAAELRQRREDYFTNAPLLVNAKRMFDLLEDIADAPHPTADSQNKARDLIVQIKTQQWKPEQPTQG